MDQVQSGQAILFLGSGASMGAIQDGGAKPLSGEALRDAISDQFLSGELKNKSLSQVAEIAKSESGLRFVQEYIKEQFEGLNPAAFHLRIPSFRWHAIVTTNYDFIIERAYRGADDKKQKLFPLLGDDDAISEVTKDLDSVPFLKLHGCLSKINDPDFPLILASEEYANYKKNRETLFKLFSDWARQYPVLFCGYDLSDPNITQILYDIGDNAVNRPRHAIIKPSFSPYEDRYYTSRRIDPCALTLEDFLSYLEEAIPEQKRMLGALLQNKSILSKWIQADAGIESEGLSYYLSNELEYINDGLSSRSISPSNFYNGVGTPWGAFHETYDSKRNLSDIITLEAILEAELESKARLFLILGHAGSGKSVIIKRLAWDASIQYSCLVFFLKDGGTLRREYIEEIWQLTKEEFFIFVESSIEHLDEIESIFVYCKRFNIPVTFIIEARTNEWNVAGSRIDKYLTKTYEVIDMTGNEIDYLLDKLEYHKCLGVLSDIPKAQRAEHIKVTADKQLLVALLEATQGKSLEEIVLDEYQNITPSEARVLYLDVCTLHRFGIAVRAGLISRITNITFRHFSSRLLKPLEHVVRTFVDSYSRDNAYCSRHQEIAKVVFERILDTPERKAEQIVRLISNMNVDYQSDSRAFDQMIKGRSVAEAFADKSLGNKVYLAAANCGANMSYILHQQAIFELNHPSGNYSKALNLIDESYRHAKRGQKAIKHTRALILRRLAITSTEPLQKDKYRTAAKLILRQQIQLLDSSYPLSTLLNILIDELQDRFIELESSSVSDESNDRVCEGLTTELESRLYQGSQDYPGDDVLLSIESKYAGLIGETPRAIRQIEAAYTKNPNSTYTAISFSKLKERTEGFDSSFEILSDSLERNPTSRQLHLNIATLCIRHCERERIPFIDMHLRKSFTDGDSNYEAQYWYARHNYLFGDRNKSDKIYRSIRKSKLSNSFKDKKRGIHQNTDGEPIEYHGLVVTKETSYCFVDCAEIGDSIFIHYSDFIKTDWDSVSVKCKTAFQLGFSLRGPVGLNASLENES